MDELNAIDTDVRRGRPIGDRTAKRNELLAAAIKVMAEFGYAGASLRKVAKAAGYTTGAVTYYFDNKDDLTAAMVEYLFDAFDEMLFIGAGVSGIKERFRSWLALNADSDIWLAGFQLLARARHDPALAAIYEKRYEQYRAQTARTLRALQETGEIRSDIAAELLADHVGAIGDGWMVMLPLEPQRFAPERVDALIDSVIALLAPPSSSAASRSAGRGE